MKSLQRQSRPAVILYQARCRQWIQLTHLHHRLCIDRKPLGPPRSILNIEASGKLVRNHKLCLHYQWPQFGYKSCAASPLIIECTRKSSVWRILSRRVWVYVVCIAKGWAYMREVSGGYDEHFEIVRFLFQNFDGLHQDWIHWRGVFLVVQNDGMSQSI